MVVRKKPDGQDGQQWNEYGKDNAFEIYLQEQKRIAKNYVRIGTTYYKIISNWITPTYLKKWNKGTIIDDHGKRVLWLVPKFDEIPERLQKYEVR